MKKRLVCACTNVTDFDIIELMEKYSDINKDALKESLNIGIRCGECNNNNNSHIIDIKYSDLIKELEGD